MNDAELKQITSNRFDTYINLKTSICLLNPVVVNLCLLAYSE